MGRASALPNLKGCEMAFIKITKEIEVVRDGITYKFVPGDVVNPDKFPGLARLITGEYNDKMQRSSVKKNGT